MQTERTSTDDGLLVASFLLGLRLLKRNGCPVIAQDEATCVVYGMPKAAVEARVVDWVLPLEGIASRIVSTVRGGGG